ncbi:Nif11-like leader peptide family natural product precursor [Bosea sp. NPDC003192]|jgi:predicted ribosomally synthesized peptide with nif11-like leader|uniref:Nif11-like leader peptide family natural product precursor n=1 Tax=Bosea sp. NPDC003192 TaxID=3390551 RepID=UPI003CFE465C
MSAAEAERFVNDLATKPALLAQVKPLATGLAAVVALGKAHGYDFTLDEAKKYIQSHSPRELTDRQLDAIAGGKHHGGHSSVATSTKVVQTTAVATSAVEAAEVATTAVQVTEAAADVAAAAEAVVVVAAVLI